MLRLLAAGAICACALAPSASADAPLLRIPHHLSFGNAEVGSSGEEIVTIENRSDVTVTIFGIGVSSETGAFHFDFAANECVGAVLAPGDSCTYGILYEPVVAGRQTGNSDIEFAGADNSLGIASIGLSGHAYLPWTTTGGAG
jgi:hypothetical protein